MTGKVQQRCAETVSLASCARAALVHILQSPAKLSDVLWYALAAN